MTTPSVRPSTITPELTHKSPNIIPSDYESITYQTSLPASLQSKNQPQYLINIKAIEPSNVLLHKNSVEPLSLHTLTIVHKDASNLYPIPPSSTPAPCDNRTKFELLNLHRIFRCRQFRNQKHLTAATNASLVNSGLLPSNIGFFVTIVNQAKGKPIKKRRQFLEKVHIEIVVGDCVAL